MSDILGGSEWRVVAEDCITHMAEMPPQSVDMSVYSPPFPSLYAYSSSASDIGNSEDLKSEAKLHLSFFYRQMARLIKPGRVMVVHVAQIPRMKRSGEAGLFDFRGLNIRLAERAGLVFEYDWAVRKNPQSQAIRTKSRELQFAGLESDRAKQRGCLPDYLLKFRAPGENKVKIDAEAQVSRNEWIKWAECTWDDIQETDTLNVKEGRGDDDTKHVCVAKGSLVLTEGGHKPIEDVSIGELVLTHKGRWRRVVAKACNGIAKTVAVHAQGVPGLATTPEHLFFSRSHVGPGGNGRPGGVSHQRTNAMKSLPGWERADCLAGSYVSLPLPPVEETEWSESEWWIAGRWLGDGHWDSCKSRGLHISCGKHEVDDLRRKLGQHAGAIRDTGTSCQIRLRDRSGRLRKLISKFGSGASNKNVPREALSLPPRESSSFLDGYLSADGHFVDKYCRRTASSVSRALLLGMSIVAQRVCGVACSVYAGRPGGECVIDGRTVSTKDEWVLSIPPKNCSAFTTGEVSWKKVRIVEDYGEREVWDLQVEEDESFVVEGCSVHNCPLQLEVVRRLVLLYTNPGEIVFSPFTGIGSEGFVSLGGKSPKTGKRVADPRRFYGCEIKPEYIAAAKMNLERAVRGRKETLRTLFDDSEDEVLFRRAVAGGSRGGVEEGVEDDVENDVENNVENDANAGFSLN